MSRYSGMLSPCYARIIASSMLDRMLSHSHLLASKIGKKVLSLSSLGKHKWALGQAKVNADAAVVECNLPKARNTSPSSSPLRAYPE